MVQKICPICDQVMKSAHYCRNCRRWVRYPYVRDVAFHLNEQHPQDEAGCSYHKMDSRRVMKAEDNAMARPEGSAGGPAGAGRQPALAEPCASPDGVWKPVGLPQTTSFPSKEPPKEPLRPERTVYQADRSGSGKGSPPRSGSRAVIGIFLVAAAVSLVSSFSGQMLDTIRSVLEPQVEYDIDLGDFTGEETEGYYEELREEDVIARGERCNARGHFAVQGKHMEQPVLDILQSAGLRIAHQDTYSYNEVNDDGETWYTTWTSIEVSGETESSYQYVELDFDTGTGELHEISLSLDDPEQLASVTCAILAALAEEGELGAGADCFTLLPEELPGAMENGNGYKRLEGAVLIEGISYEKSYSVYISHNKDSSL